MWRIHCRLFGPSGEPRWFVVKDSVDGMRYATNANGRPQPFSHETDAEAEAARRNAHEVAFCYEDFDARR